MSLPKSETWHGLCHQQQGRANLQDALLLLLLPGQATYYFTSDLKACNARLFYFWWSLESYLIDLCDLFI